MQGELRSFAAADVRPRKRRVQFLRAVPDDVTTGGLRQFVEFIEGILRFPPGTGFEVNSYEEDPFRPGISGLY
jgi:hypothetical protein